jgi:hypothetical protein
LWAQTSRSHAFTQPAAALPASLTATCEPSRVVASDHPGVKGREQLFEAADRPSAQVAAGEEAAISH